MRLLQQLAVVATALTYAWRMNAQVTSSATCVTDTWTANQEGVSPCLVAAALQGACNAGRWNINPLPIGSQYSGPLGGQSSKCQCSTVTFSMVSACGACQEGSIATWASWKTNCSSSDISISSFPITIPAGFTVPAWAYLNVTAKGIWDPTDALNSHNSSAPDSSAVSATATATVTPTSSSSLNSTGVPAPNSNTSSSKSSTNAGAIAGGVVGGVVGLALVGLIAFFFWRRRRAATAPPSAQFAGISTLTEKLGLTGPSPSYGGFQTPALPMQTAPLKLYDPSDPSTFPASPSPSLPVYPLSTSPAPSAPYSQNSAPYSNISGPLSPTATYSQASANGHRPQLSQTSQGHSGLPEV
ncbi:hypothetical protein JB92DRAFT_3059041 [Gautieria morchelliformis]|nr:hypothetical protein JB92DRAFT_3059041 [Gautieria morchelliformis]